METTFKGLFLGAKVTEFETSRYLKVFVSAMNEDEDPNIFGFDVMICSADHDLLYEFRSLKPLKPYEFRTKVMSGAKQRISIKILGIKETTTERATEKAAK